jgi:Flp pilus assembly protein TadD
VGGFEDAVKNRNWLNISEYLLLIGSGVGSVATAASQQILYTAAPVTVLFLLNLLNRRRIELGAYETTVSSVAQLDQKLSTDLGLLQKQVQALPSFLDLASLRKALQNANQAAVAGLAQEVARLQKDVVKPEDWQLVYQSIRHLQEHYNGLAESVTQLTTQLNRLGLSSRLEELEEAIAQFRSDLSNLRVNLDNFSQEQKQNNFRVLHDQIGHINRRLNQLPTPFDPASLKQDINSLVKAMGDMASRRELSRLMGQIEQLSQQNESMEQSIAPLRLATTILKKQVDTVSGRLSTIAEESEQISQAEPKAIADLKGTIASLEDRLNQLPPIADSALLQTEVKKIISAHVGQLRRQLATVQKITQDLEQQQQSLNDWVLQLPHLLDATALQNQMKQLETRVEWAATSNADLATQVDTVVKQHLDEVLQQMQATVPVPQYELVFDVKGSQSQDSKVSGCSSPAILEKALEQAEARLIIVYPYPTPETISPELLAQFRTFLDRRGCLDIGWGHLGHTNDYHLPRSIDRRRNLNPIERGFLHETLNQLTQLKRQYPNQFRFKVLGTDENFLVCDRTYAIMGAQSIFTASTVFPKAAVGLRTIDPEVIQKLVQRFDEPLLEAEDVTAYLKRALTRYDLGDKQGAIADYTHILQINPNDDVVANNRGLAHYDLGNLREAVADFDLAIQQNPQNVLAFFNRGYLRAELGDRLGAIEDYTFAIQLNPDYAPAYFYRGLSRTRMRNKIGAIEDYSEVIRLNPDNAAAYFYRGLALIKLGEQQEGVNDLQMAARLYTAQGDSANYQQVEKALQRVDLEVIAEDTSIFNISSIR